jgi:glyoxylase-like metal-dependent hydrolase (beta-lactamase superfamily II)
MGEESDSEVIDIRVKDNEKINVENIELISIYTPGHTKCSYSFLMNDRVFTGDTLLINGSGRTDFQGGNALDQYDSIFNKLLKLPEKTLVYPAHDYNGKKVSTIVEEKNNNPRLQVSSSSQYLEIMNNLNLANPKMMDIAVPANKKGLTLEQI